MKTAIVTDSNCGISKNEADRLGLSIVPMPVNIDNIFYYEGIDLDQKVFLIIYQTIKKSIPLSLHPPNL